MGCSQGGMGESPSVRNELAASMMLPLWGGFFEIRVGCLRATTFPALDGKRSEEIMNEI